MDNNKPPKRDPNSRFAEVTRLSKEARAKKPRQLPNEERPNPYAIKTPNEPDPEEKP